MTAADHDRDFHQLAGRFDQPISPSPAFTERLRSRLTEDHLPTQSTSTFTTAQQAIPSIRHSERSEESRRPNAIPASYPTSSRPARLSRTMRIAAAILALLVATSAFVLTLQPEESAQLAFQPPAEPPVTEFNANGDPGMTGNLGPTIPEMQSFEQRGRIPTEQGGIWGSTLTGSIDSNSVFLVDQRFEGRDTLFRYDLEQQKVIWERDFNVPSTLASDGARLYVVIGDNLGDTTSGQLVALDISTGETVWEGPALADRFTHAATLVVDGDMVYAADYVGNVVAVNAYNGTTKWQYPDQFREPTADEVDMVGSHFSLPALVVNDAFVYTVRPSRSIAQLDRQSGQELSVLPVLDIYGPEVFAVRLMATNDVLIAHLLRPERKVDEATGRGLSPADVLVLNPTTLTTRHHVSLTDSRGPLALHQDILFVPTQDETGSTVILMIDILTGKTTNTITYIETRWDTLLSISGGVLMATGDPSGIWFIDAKTGDQLGHIELGITNSDNPFEFPVQMWGDQAIVITFFGEVYRITDDPPTATPT